jgi:hypothetical protein
MFPAVIEPASPELVSPVIGISNVKDYCSPSDVTLGGMYVSSLMLEVQIMLHNELELKRLQDQKRNGTRTHEPYSESRVVSLA